MIVEIEKVHNGYIVCSDNIKSVIETNDDIEDTKSELIAFQNLCYLLKDVFGANNDKHKGLYLDISVTEGSDDPS